MIRDIAGYALGAGSASLPLEQTGELELLRHLARVSAGREVVLFDVGANNGAYALAARKIFGPSARIECFEPALSTFEMLEQRFAEDSRTTCHRVGLSAAPGTATLYSTHSGSVYASLYPDNAEVTSSTSTEIELVTLDSLIQQLRVPAIDLLKVDVEGHELAVLEGGRESLAHGLVRAVQFEFGGRSLPSRAYLHDFIDLLGPRYEYFRVTPRGLLRLRGLPADEMFLRETNYAAIIQRGFE